MLAIRQFQEERSQLQAEIDKLEKISRQETLKREEAEWQLGEVWEELEYLRAQQAERGPSTDTQAAEQAKRAHHEKQLKFMATIDGLRRDLQQEQSRARALEKRAIQAEIRIRQSSSEELDGTRIPLRRAGSGCSGTTDISAAESQAVRTLEDEALKLREELNVEKQKVVELKKAAIQRSARWKEQVEQITQDVGAKQRLEEENQQLRLEHARVTRELGQLQERDEELRKEAEQMRKDVAEAREAGKDARTEAAGKVEEMQLLSSVVGDQLVAVEQELTQQVQKSNQLFELFLRHSLQPLSSVRRCCRQLAPELSPSVANRELGARPAPPMYEANVHDLKNNLVKLVNLLRYSAEVLEAHAAGRQSQRSSGSGGAALEESKGFTPGWLQGVLA